MPRAIEPYLIRERSDQPGDWLVWLRPLTGLPPSVCRAWTRRSLRTAPMDFLACHPWPKSKKSAKAVAYALIEYLRREEEHAHPAGGPSVKDYATLFADAATSPRAKILAAKGEPYSPNTIATYKDIIENHVITDEEFGKLRMPAVSQQDLINYFSRLQGKVSASRTLQNTWQILHMVFKCWHDEHKTESPFRGMSKPSYQETIRGALSEAELVKLFDGEWPSPQDRAICSLAFWGGLRRSEIFALTWDGVDLEGKRLVVTRAYKRFSRTNATIGGTKGKKTRIVPMVLDVADALKALRGEGDPPLPGLRVILREDGSDPNARDWRTAMERAFRRAGIDTKGREVTPHSARHSIASVLLARGVPKDYIRQILGHFDERTTDGYLHMAAEEIDKMRVKVDEKKKPRGQM